MKHHTSFSTITAGSAKPYLPPWMQSRTQLEDAIPLSNSQRERPQQSKKAVRVITSTIMYDRWFQDRGRRESKQRERLTTDNIVVFENGRDSDVASHHLRCAKESSDTCPFELRAATFPPRYSFAQFDGQSLGNRDVSFQVPSHVGPDVFCRPGVTPPPTASTIPGKGRVRHRQSLGGIVVLAMQSVPLRTPLPI